MRQAILWLDHGVWDKRDQAQVGQWEETRSGSNGPLVLMCWIVFTWNSYVEVLPINNHEWTVFGDRALKKKKDSIVLHWWALIQYDYIKRKLGHKQHRLKTMCGQRKKMAICEPRREASEETLVIAEYTEHRDFTIS